MSVVGWFIWSVVLRRGLVRQELIRDKAWGAALDGQRELARRHGWAVDESPGNRSWPASLDDARGDRRTCLLAVTGPDFEATTWQGNEKLVGAARGLRSRLWLLTLRAPHVRDDLFVVRASGDPEQSRLVPQRLAGRTSAQGPVGSVFAGGDFDAARERLGELVDQVSASGSWVITEPGAVHVLATLVPDSSGFEWRLDLAQQVARALSG